jgi:triacylglycerol lipase
LVLGLALSLAPSGLAGDDALPSLSGMPALKHPIVLVHGATLKGARLQVGPFDFGEYFRGIEEFLGATHTTVKSVALTSDSPIGERAAVLKNFLETDFKGQQVNIVAHSLGGLDARYLVSIMHSTQVVSITTIGTPHRGTPLADWGWAQTKSHGFWYWVFYALGYDFELRRFLPEITTESMKVFNQKVPNQPEVQYFSVATRGHYGSGTMSLMLWFPRHWLESQNNRLAANGDDGLVPFDSQPWGKVLAERELDHLGQMNHHEFRFHNMEKESLGVYQLIYENLRLSGL